MLQHHPGEILIYQLFDAQPDAVVWFTPVFAEEENPDSPLIDFEAQYCNRKAAEVLGIKAEELAGSRLLSTMLIDSVTRQQIYDQCRQVWESGNKIEFNFYNRSLDRYLNVQRSKVYDGILSITRDRSKEVKAELEQKKQEERYRQILDTAADGILLFEAVRDDTGTIADFRVMHANRRAYEIGALPPQTVGSTMLTLFPHLKNSEQFDWHRRVVETDTPIRFETTFRTAKGDEFGWFIVSLTRLGDGVVSTFVDVTQRRHYEQQIEGQNQLLNKIFETSVNGMYACTALRDEQGEVIDFVMTLVNAAFTQILGVSEEQAIGKRYLTLFPAAATNGMFAFNKMVFEEKKAIRKEMYYHGDNIDGWFDIFTARLDPDGLLCTFTEITARKRLQFELEQKLEELKRTNQSLEEFAFAASHDLQEPLRKIHFFSDRLKSTLDPGSEQAGMFARMESATTRMRDLIDDLLAYSRLSVAHESFTRVDLNQVVQLALHDLEAAIQECGAEVHVDQLPAIQGDERQLRQLFLNLLGNAVKYRQPGRKPEISVRYQPCTNAPTGQDCFNIEVQDNGIGFEPEYAEKIFQVFQRLHGTREYPGSGVGLAIARKVVTNHKGIIRAESIPGSGATFRIQMPVTMLAGK
jgi:signal transduction histidine kinase